MLAPTYPIHTERLQLRPLMVTDLAAVNAYESLEENTLYVPFPPRTPEETLTRLANPEMTRRTVDREGQALRLGVVLAGTGQLIGDVLLFFRSEVHRSGELGYIFHPDHHGNGYATEAAAAMLALAFDPSPNGLGLHRVTARIDERNGASAAVLRRLGMRQEAVLVENEWFKGEWSTEVDFAILDREWRARHD